MSGERLLLDAGTGIVGLGETLEAPSRPLQILLSHYHWDHLQGLPFFAPFYALDSKVSIWAPVLGEVNSAWPDAIFRPPYFPVPFENLPSRPEVLPVEPAEIHIGSFHVRVQPLTHPGGAFAYRILGPSGDLVYATDHEFGNHEVDDQLAAFCLNTAATIFDAHFTPQELTAHKGWGHSSWRQAAEFASATGAGHLWLFHHKPGRSDGELQRIETEARQVFPATSAAAEGVEFTI